MPNSIRIIFELVVCRHDWMKGFLVLPVLLILILGTPACDSDKGQDAYNCGDYAAAFKKNELLAEQGDAGGQNGLGLYYYKECIVQQDYKIALELYALSANQGFAEAQYNLGSMYEIGLGITLDYKAAFKWYKLAAEQGHANAQLDLSIMYRNGEGVIQDYTLALMWLNIAASQGDDNMFFKLSRYEFKTKMTPSQIEQAKKLVRECVAKNYKDC